jgi:replicative DNA helicase
MIDALELRHYLLAHAKAAYGEIGTDPVVEDARALLRAIQHKGWTEVTKRELFEATKGRFKKVPSMEPALTLLVQHEYVRPLPSSSRNTRGRPPSPGYAVNPLMLSHNSHNSVTAQAELTERFLAPKADPSEALYSDLF